MPEIRRSALMPYPARFMYDVVNNVDSYPDFLPWCGGVETHRMDETSMEASILMRGAGLNHWFKTRNSMEPGKSIAMALLKGPFSKLEGLWRFTPVDPEGCKVELALQYELKQGLAAVIIAPAFSRIANTMVSSFCERGNDLYEP
ncbi:MAG: type II toxin-antitoxin system RatA family toxin [Gammaproteobacteria bacterium]|nr:type II toxin-antitoxin system RatA family toxin [Gammaproteobacteria bacterium]